MHLISDLLERAIRLAGPQTANRLLRSMLRGYEHLSYARLRDLGFKPSTIFDIGAYRGAWSAGARTIFPDAKIVMIEAQPELRPVLCTVAERIGNASVHTALLGAREEDQIAFYTMGTGSSVRPERSNAAREVASMRATTLDKVWNHERRPGRVFVKIDVQGSELDVLKGGDQVFQDVEWFQLETALLQYNEGAPLLQEVCNFMADRGFLATEITGFSRPRQHLVQVDVLFAREGSVLRPQKFEF